jgi:hypothetical protein
MNRWLIALVLVGFLALELLFPSDRSAAALLSADAAGAVSARIGEASSGQAQPGLVERVAQVVRKGL